MNLTDLMRQIRSSKFICEITRSADAYFVGGAIRDLFLNKDPKDIDIVVCGMTDVELVNILNKHGKVELVGKSFGCFKFMPKDFHVDEPIDFALARTERKTGKGHKGFEMVTDPNYTILDDLGRRDFTINSIAVNVIYCNLEDPYNGLKDLENKIIRCVNEKAFIEDPLRIVRALQFAARFGFEIESKTLQMMEENINLLSFQNDEALTGERVFEEIKKVWNKKGDLNKFVESFAKYCIAMLNKDAYISTFVNSNTKYGIFEDFLISIAYQSNTDVDVITNGFKVDCKTKRALECILEYTYLDVQIVATTNEVCIDSEIIKYYKKDIYTFDSVFFPKKMKDRVKFLKENGLPMSLKELDKKYNINGNSLMKLGFKGVELGEELHTQLLREMKVLD